MTSSQGWGKHIPADGQTFVVDWQFQGAQVHSKSFRTQGAADEFIYNMTRKHPTARVWYQGKLWHQGFES